MVVPFLGVQISPHLCGVISTCIRLCCLNRLWHTRGGGIQVAGERTNEVKQVWVALCQVHRGGTAHGDTDDGALLVGAELIVQNWHEFLGQEGLPHVVLAVIRLSPVRVERGFAAHWHDHVDVLVGVVLLDIGLNGPAGFIVTRTQAIECPHLWELLIWLGVPVTSQEDLYYLLMIWHGGRLNVDLNVAWGEVLYAVDINAFWQAFYLWVGGVDGIALRWVAWCNRVRKARATWQQGLCACERNQG